MKSRIKGSPAQGAVATKQQKGGVVDSSTCLFDKACTAFLTLGGLVVFGYTMSSIIIIKDKK